MMKGFRNHKLATIAALTIALVPATAGADPQPATHIDTLTASRSGSVVQVSGAAAFVDVPSLVADEAGDSSTYDVTQATISRVPGSSNLKFIWTINPNSLPDVPTLTYMWPISVDGVQDGLWLQASRNNGSTAPGFALNKLLSTGQYTTVTTLSGSMTPTKVEWTVPMFRINAVGGSMIEQGAAFAGGSICPAGSTGGPAGFYSCGTTFDTVNFEPATVPSATVEVGIATAGTPPALVSLTHNATVVANGSFSSSLDVAGLPAGEYVVVAEACYVAGVCGLSSTDITL
ncbi:MAG TPA: hypothetical protein VGB51_04395 [Actinomycetota bacterium]